MDSLLDQTQPAFEVVVVDDGSSDNSREVLDRYGSRVTVILSDNRGQTSASNLAISCCTGDVVALLDSDDLALPSRLDRLTDAYQNNPQAQWIFHGLAHVERHSLRRLDTAPHVGFEPGPHDHRTALTRGRLPITMPATSALSWRRDFLDQLMPVPTDVVSADNYLKFASLALAPGYVLMEQLSLQGIHDTNMFTGATGATRRRFRAKNTLAMLSGYDSLGPALRPLSDRLMGQVFVISRGTTDLSKPLRGRYWSRWKGMTLRRRMAVVQAATREALSELWWGRHSVVTAVTGLRSPKSHAPR